MKFLDWFAKYVGVQGVLAFIMTIAIIAWTTIDVLSPAIEYKIPNDMFALLGLAWGFYFGKNGKDVLSGINNKIAGR